jgi:hypothetical protein
MFSKALIILTLLTSSTVFAGEATICELVARDAAKAVAHVNGSKVADIKSASNKSLNPDEGDQYEVKIGTQRYLVTTLGIDGDCFANTIIKMP